MIAIVDDDAAVRDAVADLLEVLKLSAEPFASAEAFLARYTPGGFGCVVTDVRMGAISGLELMARLTEAEPALPVILLTAEPLRAADGQDTANAYAVLNKPVDAIVLASHVLRAMGYRG